MSEGTEGRKTGLLARLFGRGKPKPEAPHVPTEVELLREEVAEEFREEEEAKKAAAEAAREAEAAEAERIARKDADDAARDEPDAPSPEPAPDTVSPATDRREEAVGPAPSGAPDPVDAPALATRDAVPTTPSPAPPPPVAPTPIPSPPAAQQRGFFARLSQGLTKTSSSLTSGIGQVFTKRKLDAATLEELEDLLIQADLGVETAMRVTEAVGEGRYGREIAPDEVREILAHEVARVLDPVARPMPLDPSLKPQIVLVVGVNGSGKTTTIGKLAAKFTTRGKTVMLAAGDTFRAAAVEQLKVWGERTGAPVVTRPHGADAASLAFDAVKEAKAKGVDVLMIDTAGRLQNKAELMAELEKVVRVIRKIEPKAPHTVLLVLDATVGQNAMSQVEVFKRTAGVTGLAMTKLDGTAKGGILVAIAAKHRLPIHFVGVGEGIDDLEPFDPEEFAAAIVGAG